MTHPRGRRLRHLAAIGAVAIVAALLTAPVSGAAQAADPTTIPGVDEIVSSPNLKQVAHRDKIGPFANSTNSDWAFQGKYAYSGNYNGFTAYRRLLQQRRLDDRDAGCPVGGHQGLRHQQSADPALPEGGQDGLRLAHPDAGAG